MNRTNKLERLRSINFKKQIKELKEELTFKDQKLEESWSMYREEFADKRSCMKDLRIHRSETK
jgi:hypothetical protein